jgi:hypothetical protein
MHTPLTSCQYLTVTTRLHLPLLHMQLLLLRALSHRYLRYLVRHLRTQRQLLRTNWHVTIFSTPDASLNLCIVCFLAQRIILRLSEVRVTHWPARNTLFFVTILTIPCLRKQILLMLPPLQQHSTNLW